jgi:hypothetical protein
MSRVKGRQFPASFRAPAATAQQGGGRILCYNVGMEKPKLTDFRPQAKNPNRHSAYGMRLLEKSLQQDGFIGAQTAAADGEIIAGSARQEIAVEKFTNDKGENVEPIIVHTTGDRPVIIVRDDIANANTARARRLSVAENAVANVNYDPDYSLLADWAKDDGGIKELFSEREWQEGTGEGNLEYTSTDRDKQGVSSTWGQVAGAENDRIIIGDLETRLPVVVVTKLREYLENEYAVNGTPIQKTLENFIVRGLE